MFKFCKKRRIWTKRRSSFPKWFFIICIFLLGMSANLYYSDGFKKQREEMVLQQISSRGIKDTNILNAMRTVPRHLFVPAHLAKMAYEDFPLNIGFNQTISQPYVVALMTQSGQITPQSKVLEIGTGSGYQTAILASLCREVYSIEIMEPLAKKAQNVLKQLEYTNIRFRIGDGWNGWPEKAPFDAIIVTAASPKVPQSLLHQLKEGGRLIMPIGSLSHQYLMCYRKQSGKFLKEKVIPVKFVPITRTSIKKAELDIIKGEKR